MGYWHKSVNHRAKEYVSDSGTTVNGMEGYWASLKRGINGTHIHVSPKHLPKYLAEFEYRWNMRATPHLMLDRLMVSFRSLGGTIFDSKASNLSFGSYILLSFKA